MIAVFDSGVGGLSVLREILERGVDDDVVYIADRANAPYGDRSLEGVRDLTLQHAESAIGQGSSTIVIACNTASAAALKSLRARYPDTRFVGMEPAIKPAAAATGTGKIGVLATRATFQGRLFASLVGDFGADIEILTTAAPEWVDLVEAGTTSGPSVRDAVAERIEPLLDSGADVLVLGCTHFPFLAPELASVVNGRASIIDPSPAVAGQALSVHRSEPSARRLSAMVSGDIAEFIDLAQALAGVAFPDGVLRLGQND